MFLIYHRRLRIISVAPDLRVEGECAGYSWFIGVAGDGYGGFGGGRDGGGGWHACRTRLLHAEALPECEVIH